MSQNTHFMCYFFLLKICVCAIFYAFSISDMTWPKTKTIKNTIKVSVVQHLLQFLFVLQQIILSWSTGDHDSIWHFSGSFCPWYCVKCHRMHFAMWFWASNRLEVKNWISLCLDKTFRVLQPPVQLQHKHYEHIFLFIYTFFCWVTD